MPRAAVGEVELEYLVEGQGEPMVLIMGIGAQMVHWPQGLIDGIVGHGFQVLRFDNRDVGYSTRLRSAPVPDISRALPKAWLGMKVPTPYNLSDMAGDVAGLLDHLGWDQAHVVGVSMGGMIAQTFAIEHPTRTRTLTSIMSTTGSRLASVPKPKALKTLLSGRAETAEQAEAWMLNFMRTVNGPAFPVDEELVRDLARRSFERGGANPEGFLRQFGAILASGDRTPHLRNLKTPTLVMHGTADPLVPPKGGKETAKAVPGARLRLVEGWGHGMPPGVWPTLIEEITAHARAHPVQPG